MIEAFWQSVLAFVWQPIVQFWRKFLADLENPDYDKFWQALHFSAGLVVTLSGAVCGGLYAAKHAGSGHQVLVSILVGAAIGAFLVGVVWGCPKEFGFDVIVEKATAWGGVRDLSFYAGGIATAFALILAVGWYLGVN